MTDHTAEPRPDSTVVSRLVGPWEPARDPLADDPVAYRLGLVDAEGRRLCDCLVGADCPHMPAREPATEQPEPAPPGAAYCTKCREWDMDPVRAPRCPTCGKPWTGVMPKPAGPVREGEALGFTEGGPNRG